LLDVVGVEDLRGWVSRVGAAVVGEDSWDGVRPPGEPWGNGEVVGPVRPPLSSGDEPTVGCVELGADD